jgi:hypothetical protein
MMTTSNKEISYENFVQVLQGHSAFQLLWAGVEFGVFEILNETPNKFTAEDLSFKLGLEVNPSKILFDGLLTLKLIVRVERTGVLKNAKVTEKYLAKKSPVNLVGMAEWQRYIVYPAAIDFCEALRTNKNIGIRHFPGEGNTLYQRLASNPKLEKVFQDAMQSISNAANHMLVEYLYLTKFSHLLDFGGGNGTNAMTFYEKNPHLKVTILDMPTVCEKAKINIEKYDLSAHISTLPGDFFTTMLPKDLDCVLYSHIVTIWSPENNIKLLKRIFDALPENGQVFIFSTMGNDNGIGPMLTAMGSVYFQTIATGEGMLYSKKEVKSFVEKAGFSVTIKEGLSFDHTLVIGTKKELL